MTASDDECFRECCFDAFGELPGCGNLFVECAVASPTRRREKLLPRFRDFRPSVTQIRGPLFWNGDAGLLCKANGFSDSRSGTVVRT